MAYLEGQPAPPGPSKPRWVPTWNVAHVGLVAAGAASALAVHLATGSLPAALLAALAVAAVAGASGTVTGSRATPAGVALAERNSGMTTRIEALEPVLRGLPDPTLILDGNENVLAANEPARRLLTVAVGRHISASCRAPELLSLIGAAHSRGEQQQGETRLLGPVEHHLNIVATRIAAAPAPGAPALLVVLRDLSEQEQLTRMRADFVANASHELRTPLASLKGFLETVRGPAASDPAAREKFIGIMQEQADRMSRLIDDLLSLSRIEMREHVRPLDRIDITEIVQYVARTVEPLASKAGVRVSVVLGSSPMLVRGDRDELIQMLQNLTQNAIKYGRAGGTVRMSLTREANSAVLAVADDGIGIAPEHLPRLTERFYRVSAKDSRERGGTGLGLAIVKHIVNRHLGELQVTSTPGKGSTFTVRLPAESHPGA